MDSGMPVMGFGTGGVMQSFGHTGRREQRHPKLPWRRRIPGAREGIDRAIVLEERSILQLPIDELGLEVLRDFDQTGQWNDHNYVNEARNAGYGKPALDALSEAIGWLRARGLVTPDLSQHSSNAAFVTRFGRKLLDEGPGHLQATAGLQPAGVAKHRICTHEQRSHAVLLSFSRFRVSGLRYSSGSSSIEGFDLGLRGPSGALASASASAFASRGTHVILMSANCWIKEVACLCKGLSCSALTFDLPFSWSTNSWESRHTRKCPIPLERAASRPLMRARYSATWWSFVGPIASESSSRGAFRTTPIAASPAILPG